MVPFYKVEKKGKDDMERKMPNYTYMVHLIN